MEMKTLTINRNRNTIHKRLSQENRMISLQKTYILFIVVICLSNLSGHPESKDSHTDHISYNNILSDKEYFTGLFKAGREDFEYHFAYPFLSLLDEKQSEYFTQIEILEKKKRFIELYWKQTNPNPFLETNEWLKAFIERCRYVKENFATEKPPYYDDRGKYYYKWGPPGARYQDKGGIRSMDPQTRRLMETIFRGTLAVRPSFIYKTYPNESWNYDHITEDLVIHFINVKQYFEETDDIFQAIQKLDRKSRGWILADFFKKRGNLSNQMLNSANEIEHLEERLMMVQKFPEMFAELALEITGTGGSLNPREPPLSQLMRFESENIRHFQNIEESNLKTKSPWIVFVPDQAIDSLLFSHDIAQFRGPNGTTCIEFTLLVPIEKNLIPSFMYSEGDTLTIDYSYFIRDRVLSPVERRTISTKLPVQLMARHKMKNGIGRLSAYSASQPNCNLTLQIKDHEKGFRGFRKQIIDIRNFNGDSLMISDIQFFMQFQDRELQQTLPTIRRKNSLLTPYPYQKIHKQIPMHCYFELYNLITSGIIDTYDLTYRISKDTNRLSTLSKITGFFTGANKHAISVTQTLQVAGNFNQELIALDLSKLSDGPYLFEIFITYPEDDIILARSVKKIHIAE